MSRTGPDDWVNALGEDSNAGAAAISETALLLLIFIASLLRPASQYSESFLNFPEK
jgi:hypothetical protein